MVNWGDSIKILNNPILLMSTVIQEEEERD